MTIRVGLFGAAWGAFAHLPAWRAIPGVEVVAVCTSRQETAEAAAAWQDMAQGLNQWDITTSAGQVGLVQSKAHESLCTKTGFKAYSKKELFNSFFEYRYKEVAIW